MTKLPLVRRFFAGVVAPAEPTEPPPPINDPVNPPGRLTSGRKPRVTATRLPPPPERPVEAPGGFDLHARAAQVVTAYGLAPRNRWSARVLHLLVMEALAAQVEECAVELEARAAASEREHGLYGPHADEARAAARALRSMLTRR